MPTSTAQRGQGHALSCCNGPPTIRACPSLGTCWTRSKPPGMAMWWSSRTPEDATPPRASSTPSGTTATMATTPWSGPPPSPGQAHLDYPVQYLCQLRKAEGGLRGMNTAQAGDLVENLGQ